MQSPLLALGHGLGISTPAPGGTWKSGDQQQASNWSTQERVLVNGTGTGVHPLDPLDLLDTLDPTLDGRRGPYGQFSQASSVFLAVLMTLLVFATVLGNALVILAFVVEKSLRTQGNFFFLNLAIADFLVGGFCIPVYIPYVLTGEWRLGRGVCTLWLVVDYTLCTASVFNIVLISFDRFLSVTRAVSYRSQKGVTREAVAKMLSVWLAAFLLYGPAIISWEHLAGRSVVPSGLCYAEFYFNWYFLITASAVEFFTPFLSVAYFNLSIYVNIRNRCALRQEPPACLRLRSLESGPFPGAHRQQVFFVRPAEDGVGVEEGVPLRSRSQYCCQLPNNRVDSEVEVPSRSRYCFQLLNNREASEVEGVPSQSQSQSRSQSWSRYCCGLPNNRVASEVEAPSRFLCCCRLMNNQEASEVKGVPSRTHYCCRLPNNRVDSEVEGVPQCQSRTRSRYCCQLPNNRVASEVEVPSRSHYCCQLPNNREASEVGVASQSQSRSRCRYCCRFSNNRESGEVEVPSRSHYCCRLLNSRVDSEVEGVPSQSQSKSQSRSQSWYQSRYCSQHPNNRVHKESGKQGRGRRVRLPGSLPHRYPDPSSSLASRFRLSRDKKVAKSLAVIVCVFGLCWAPYTLLMIIRAACQGRCVQHYLYEMSFWLLWINSSINPVLYPLCHSSFRRAFGKLLCPSRSKVQPQDVQPKC